jgi:hypothetical protein
MKDEVLSPKEKALEELVDLIKSSNTLEAIGVLRKIINHPIADVAEFHELFNHPIKDSPGIPDLKRCQLRYNLLAEEVKEFKMAYEVGDLRLVADALCDIQYVLSGAVLEFGLHEKFAAMFQEIHDSNMSKACNTELEARNTVAYWENLDPNEPCFYVKKGDVYLVFRRSDNKVMKSVNYQVADLDSILNAEE